jgi:biopolymer transport protein ExbB
MLTNNPFILQLGIMFDRVQFFIEQGGMILWVIFATCLLLWFLIIERILFFKLSYPARAKQTIHDWLSRRDRNSWQAHQIRTAIVSELSQQLHAFLPLIKTLTAICPLLGLLGTVTGMVRVFEVIASAGTSDAQAMAQGIYQATIPTMAGLVVALSGLYFTVRLRQLAARETSKLADQLLTQDLL